MRVDFYCRFLNFPAKSRSRFLLPMSSRQIKESISIADFVHPLPIHPQSIVSTSTMTDDITKPIVPKTPRLRLCLTINSNQRSRHRLLLRRQDRPSKHSRSNTNSPKSRELQHPDCRHFPPRHRTSICLSRPAYLFSYSASVHRSC